MCDNPPGKAKNDWSSAAAHTPAAPKTCIAWPNASDTFVMLLPGSHAATALLPSRSDGHALARGLDAEGKPCGLSRKSTCPPPGPEVRRRCPAH